MPVAIGDALRRLRMLSVASLLAAAFVTVWQAPAVSAHAELASSSPAARSVLTAAPTKLVLTFTEGVTPAFRPIRLTDSAGIPVQLGEVVRTADDTLTVSIPLPLDDGTYVVAWRVASDDSHLLSGAFTFSVGAVEATSATLVQDALAAANAGAPDREWIRIGRLLSYLGLVLGIGGLSVLAFCAPELLASRRAAVVLLGAVGLVVGGTALLGAAQSAGISGSWTSWGDVVGTPAGRWWFMRIVLAIIGGVLIVRRRRLLVSSGARWAAVSVGVALLAVTAAAGHAVSGRWVRLGFASTMLHLAAASVWAGGLLVLVLLVPRTSLWSVASKFSPVALWSVALLAVTGVLNAWRQMGSIGALTDTAYGQALLGKLIVVAIVVAAASFARWTLTVGTDRSHVGGPDDSSGVRRDRRLVRTVAIEAVGVVVVLAITSVLVGAAPPVASSAQGLAPSVQTIEQRGKEARIELAPAVTGGTTLDITLHTVGAGLNEDAAEEITITAVMPNTDGAPINIPPTVVAPNRVTATDVDLPTPGAWEITVIATWADGRPVVFTGQFEVQQP